MDSLNLISADTAKKCTLHAISKIEAEELKSLPPPLLGCQAPEPVRRPRGRPRLRSS